MDNIKKIIHQLQNPFTFKILLGFVIFAVILSLSLFLFPSASKVAEVNNTPIFIKDFEKRANAEIKYKKDKQGVKFEGEEGQRIEKEIKEKVLSQMIEDIVVKQEAKKTGIIIAQTDIDDEYNRIAKVNGGEQKFKEIISNYYGFTEDDYKIYNVTPKMLKQKLQEKISSSEEINKEAKDKAENILKELKSGKDFSDLAKKYSDDKVSSENGGDIGWIQKGQMVQEFETVAFSLESGIVSNVFKTAYGYHIVKIDQKELNKIKVRQILIKTKSFTDWIENKVKQAKVKKYSI